MHARKTDRAKLRPEVVVFGLLVVGCGALGLATRSELAGWQSRLFFGADATPRDVRILVAMNVVAAILIAAIGVLMVLVGTADGDWLPVNR